MILLVDAGNSRLKWSVVDAVGQISPQQALVYGERSAVDVFADLLDKHPHVKQVTLVHVLNSTFAQSVQTLCEQKPVGLHQVSSIRQGYGVTVAYRNPAALGADRFVGMVAARHVARGQACMVIDCGTAATIDAMDAEGRHLGGVILPGLQLSAETLVRRAQGKLDYSFANPTVLADGTERAIGGGCLFGLLGAIEGICGRMQQALPAPAQRILTGGDAEYLYGWLPAGYHLQPDLLMQGLRHITEQASCIKC